MRNRQNRDYVKLKFALKEETIKLKKASNGEYNLTFKYDALGSVLISLFTHVEDSSEMIHAITQGMKIQDKGWEDHVACREGTDMPHETLGVKIDTSDAYSFIKNESDVKDHIYPFVVRMVSPRRITPRLTPPIANPRGPEQCRAAGGLQLLRL